MAHEQLQKAHARGARIQIFCPRHGEWETIGGRGDRGLRGETPSWAPQNQYRIHPDDLGRISGTLRRLSDFLATKGL